MKITYRIYRKPATAEGYAEIEQMHEVIKISTVRTDTEIVVEISVGNQKAANAFVKKIQARQDVQSIEPIKRS